MKYIVRKTVEHSIVVQALSKDDAVEVASNIPMDHWDVETAWEAEEE